MQEADFPAHTAVVLADSTGFVIRTLPVPDFAYTAILLRFPRPFVRCSRIGNRLIGQRLSELADLFFSAHFLQSISFR